jgi:tRNA-2-methylthio-N6-dimethylallyladenosine synthase
VLEAMNRQHTGDDYRRLAERIRAARPDIALSSDFIVGFPGESEEDFEETLGLVREVEFAHSYAFKYSPRPGTPGAAMPDQVPAPIKAERLARLQDLLFVQQRAFNARTVGASLPVLLEKPGRRAGQITGRSPYLQPVHVEAQGRAAIGDIVDVEIIATQSGVLTGRLFAHKAAAE